MVKLWTRLIDASETETSGQHDGMAFLVFSAKPGTLAGGPTRNFQSIVTIIMHDRKDSGPEMGHQEQRVVLAKQGMWWNSATQRVRGRHITLAEVNQPATSALNGQ
jgi:hypothetical protein